MNYFGKFDAKVSDALGQHPSAHLFSETVHATHVPSDAVVVSDAQLLFNAEFKRSGVDLVLSGEGREVVLHDYFKGAHRASIASPDGAHLTGDIVTALAGEVQYAQADNSADAHKVIGHVTKLVGSATATRNGVSIILNNGDNVEKGDVVASGSDSTLGITFIDGTVFGLSSNARMVLNEMVYDPNGSSNSSLLSLVAGTITFVAGETAKHGDMKVDTPVATMGIRGTAVLCEIDFSVPGTTPDAKFQVLVEPDGTTGSYILFDKQTLTPLAVVNQAGMQINISNGIMSQTLAPLSPEIQQLINDVFTLKFTDNSTTKSIEHFTDSIVPTDPNGQFKLTLLTGLPNIPTLTESFAPAGNAPQATPPVVAHLHGVLSASATPTNGVIIAQPTGGPSQYGVSGTISFFDKNTFDRPTVTVTATSFTLLNAQGQNINSTLSTSQINAIEAALTFSANAGNSNNGGDTWTYNIPASALSFLTAGETLTVTFNATVNNNYGPDDETATAPFTVTIKSAAEIWSETKEVASPAPGDWYNGANWQSGVAPTASDDVIIVTDPTKSGTPFYPVTIKDGGSPAVADSVTMNDSGEIPPELDNDNMGNLVAGVYGLTIGGGGLHLNADSILKNFGTISVGGLAEILGHSVLQNSGLLTLQQGGDFKDESSITNSGTIEIAGGTLNVEVNVANSAGTIHVDTGAELVVTDGATITQGAVEPGLAAALENVASSEGTIKVDSGAELLLEDRATIIQGTVTLGSSAVLDVESAEGATLDGVAVTGTDDNPKLSVAPSTVEIGVNTDGGSILTLEDGASISKGLMTIGADSVLDVESAGGATLDDVAVTSDPTATIEIGVNTEGGSILTVEDGTSVVGGNMTIAADSTLDVESAGGAMLLGVTVSSDVTSTIEIGVNTEGGSILTLADGTSIAGSNMTIAANSTLDVESSLGATLDGLNVTGTSGDAPSTIEIGANTDGGSFLTLLDGSYVSNGNMTIAVGSALDIESAGGATLDSVTVTGTNGDAPSTIFIGFDTITGSILTLLDGTSITYGNMTIAAGSVLDIESAGGATLDGVTVTGTSDPSTIEIGTLGASTLVLDDGTKITNGNLTIFGGGTLDIEAGTTVPGATLDGVTVTGDAAIKGESIERPASTIEVGTLGAATLLLDDGTTITHGKLTIAGGSTLDIEAGTTGPGATLDGVTVTGVSEIKGESSDNPASKIEVGTLGAATLLLDGGTTVTDGKLTIAAKSTLDIESSGGATLNGVDVVNSGTIQVDGAVSPATTVTLVLGDGTTITGGNLTIHDLTSPDQGVVEIKTGGATFDDLTVTNNNELIIDATVTLTLTDNTSILGGTIDDAGTLLVSSASKITDATINGGGDVTVTGGTLTLSGVTLDDVTLSGSITNADTLTIDETVTLNGATISGGTIDDTGALQGFGAIGSVITGSGALTASGGKLTLTGDNTYTGVTTINGDGTLALSGTGSISDSSDVVDNGTFDISATSGASIVTLSGSGTVDLGAATLTLTKGSTTFSGAINGTGGLTVDGTGTEILSGDNTYSGLTTIGSGETLALSSTGSIADSSDVVDNGTFDVSATSGASIVTLSGSGTVDLGAATLTLTKGSTTFSGAINGTGGLTVDGTGTETLTGDNTYSGATTIGSGETLALSGTGSISDSSDVVDNGTFDISATTSGASIVTLSGNGTVDLGTETLTLTKASTTFSGTIDGTGTGGDITVASGTQAFGTVTLDDLTLSGSFSETGTVTIDDIVTLNGATLSGGTIDVSGILDSTGTSSISGATINNPGHINVVSGTLAIDPATFTNTGTIEVDSKADLVLSGETVTNSVTVGPTTTNGTVQVDSQGLLTLSGSKINGGIVDNLGTIDVTSASSINNTFSFVNTGIVKADGAALTLSGTTVTNAGGTLESTGSGGLVDLVNAIVNNGNLSGKITTATGNSSSTLNGLTLELGTLVTATVGVLELTGIITNNGEIDANAGAVHLVSSTLDSGTLGGSGTITTVGSGLDTFDGVTIAHGTTVTVADHTALDLKDTITDAGTIALSSSGHATQLEISGNVSLSGGGAITMSDVADTTGHVDNFIVSDGSPATLTNSDTISGAGTIGDSNLTLINDGTIDATGTHSLVIATGVTNNSSGILEASAHSELDINGNVVNNGTIEANGASSFVKITGNVTNTAGSTGAIDISSGGHVEITGSVSAGETVTFEQANEAGLLTLDDSHAFAGTIAGMVEADPESAENHVDLTDLTYTANHMSVSFNSSSHMVTITNNSTHDHVALHVTVGSNFSNEFEIHSDTTIGGSGGTLLDDPSSTGTNTIDSGDVLGISGASSATIDFTNTSGNTGELLLNDSHDFTGTIVGFAGDGTIANSDLIDVADINFADVATSKTTYAENADGTGTLTLYNASGQALDSINFTGNYQLANFTVESDGNGGTLIVDPPVNSPAPANTIVASGQNQTLSGSTPGDNFVFNFAGVGHSTIANFDPAADMIQFSSSMFANVQAILNAAQDDGHGNSVIAIDAHDSITLNGVSKTQLHASDFHVV